MNVPLEIEVEFVADVNYDFTVNILLEINSIASMISYRSPSLLSCDTAKEDQFGVVVIEAGDARVWREIHKVFHARRDLLSIGRKPPRINFLLVKREGEKGGF